MFWKNRLKRASQQSIILLPLDCSSFPKQRQLIMFDMINSTLSFSFCFFFLLSRQVELVLTILHLGSVFRGYRLSCLAYCWELLLITFSVYPSLSIDPSFPYKDTFVHDCHMQHIGLLSLICGLVSRSNPDFLINFSNGTCMVNGLVYFRNCWSPGMISISNSLYSGKKQKVFMVLQEVRRE